VATKNQRNQRSSSASPDAIQLLTKDHDTVRELLEQLSKTTSRGAAKREQLYQRIAQEVRVHSQIEEEIFYPAYHEAAETQEEEKLFYEAAEEHALVAGVMAELDQGDPSSDVYAAKCKVLKDLIKHHADEEEDEMFPKARKLLGKARLEELG
jgi:hemerythrin-like domain-containing protein